MGKMTMGKQNGESTKLGQSLIKALKEVVESEASMPSVIEVPVIQIQERIIEVPVIQYQDRIVEVIKEVRVVEEKIVEVLVDKIIEVPVIQIQEKEVRVVDIQPLLIEKEKVRMLKRSNAILRIVVIGLTALSCILAAV